MGFAFDAIGAAEVRGISKVIKNIETLKDNAIWEKEKSRTKIENNQNADLPNVYDLQVGGKPLGKPLGFYDLTTAPGPLGSNMAVTFSGGKYAEIVLTQDTVLYRAGTADRPYGQFFSLESPVGIISTRVDKAVLPIWPNGAESPISSAIAIKIPAGTKVYTGEVAAQGGFYVGGTQQIVVQSPWSIPGIEIVSIKPLR